MPKKRKGCLEIWHRPHGTPPNPPRTPEEYAEVNRVHKANYPYIHLTVVASLSPEGCPGGTLPRGALAIGFTCTTPQEAEALAKTGRFIQVHVQGPRIPSEWLLVCDRVVNVPNQEPSDGFLLN
jgi:hypothetical protein